MQLGVRTELVAAAGQLKPLNMGNPLNQANCWQLDYLTFQKFQGLRS